MAGARKSPASRPRRWSAEVAKRSDALDLEPEVFKRGAAGIARSLKRSAERSHRRKGTVLSSAMSMLNFFINRAGKNLSATRRRVLEQAKVELRKQAAPHPVQASAGSTHLGGSARRRAH